MTREAWAEAFLRELGAPVTRRNLLSLVVWMQSEGSPARWNPLATTLRRPQSATHPGNTHGVQDYPSFAVGLDASVATIREARYEKVRTRLARSAWPRRTLRAIARSPWGTDGDLMRRVLDSARRGYYDDYAAKPVAT